MNMNANLRKFNNEMSGLGSVKLNFKWEKTSDAKVYSMIFYIPILQSPTVVACDAEHRHSGGVLQQSSVQSWKINARNLELA